MSEDQLRQAFINWAKHLDSDGYFGALEAFDEFIAPMWRALECGHEAGVRWFRDKHCLRCKAKADVMGRLKLPIEK